MSHWAELDDNNIVVRVLVCDNNDPNGDEGYKWLVDNLGGRWVQTSFNSNFRVRFAGVGYTYNEACDAFILPQPYPSWVLDEERSIWIAPMSRPEDGFWIWDESSLSWIEKILPTEEKL